MQNFSRRKLYVQVSSDALPLRCWSVILPANVALSQMPGAVGSCPGIESQVPMSRSTDTFHNFTFAFKRWSHTRVFKVEGSHQSTLKWHPGKCGPQKVICLFCVQLSVSRGSSVINVRNSSLTLLRSGSGLCSDVSVQLIQQPEWLIRRYSSPVLQFGLMVVSRARGPWRLICRPAKPGSSCRASELYGSSLHF